MPLLLHHEARAHARAMLRAPPGVPRRSLDLGTLRPAVSRPSRYGRAQRDAPMVGVLARPKAALREHRGEAPLLEWGTLRPAVHRQRRYGRALLDAATLLENDAKAFRRLRQRRQKLHELPGSWPELHPSSARWSTTLSLIHI
eukprot:8744858-Alexandrium_andersonii.AAC.1